MTGRVLLGRYRYEVLLAGILLLSAVLNFWNVWNQGFSNTYYAAAVKSMLTSPAAFFFNSFDAAGFITVDKPPVGLWVQVASAAIFGFSGWSLVLPQALAGVGSVFLVYLIVSRAFGKPAGLIGALALAVTPIFVAVSRNGTMDGILIFVLLLAVWAGLKAARESSLPCLLLAAILVGIAFNIKMIQAFIVVPAILAVYLVGAREVPVKRRAMHLLVAVAVLLAVSLSWAVAVDSIPADQRPYIGGSGDNTVLGLIINYNGIHRLESDSTGPGGAGSGAAGMGAPLNRTADRGAFVGMAPGGGEGARGPPEGMASGTDGSGGGAGGFPGTGGSPQTPGSPGEMGRGGGMGDENGSPGLTRLFSAGLAGQISWLLPFALIGLLALWRRPAALSLKGLEDAGLSSERGLVVLVMGLWLLPGLLYFSFTTGFWHTYYIATIAPPLAALVGIGAVAMYGAYCAGGPGTWVLVGAIAVTGVIQTVFLLYTPEWSGLLPALVLAGTVLGAAALAYRLVRNRERASRYPKIVAAGAIALLFIAPFVWSCTPFMYGSGGNLPTAGPRLAGQGGGNMGGDGPGTGAMNAMPGGMAGGNTAGLAAYLLSHTTNETWIAAEPSSMGAAGLIIETGKPVMSLGGFAGSDQVLTLDQMKQMVTDGKVRYFYIGGMGDGTGSGNSAIFSWVRSTCTEVPSSEWGGSTTAISADMPAVGESSGSGEHPGSGSVRAFGPSGSPVSMGISQENLYDCTGYRDQITA